MVGDAVCTSSHTQSRNLFANRATFATPASLDLQPPPVPRGTREVPVARHFRVRSVRVDTPDSRKHRLGSRKRWSLEPRRPFSRSTRATRRFGDNTEWGRGVRYSFFLAFFDARIFHNTFIFVDLRWFNTMHYRSCSRATNILSKSALNYSKFNLLC
ncbi:MAG: hypothetical protein UX04_C0009G0013 [Microgenomates group bacterium GW2011_GWF2_45_18]|nr:MAG: hypothetical protein UW18_C0010G0013 [Microgenomates group bacterium GW2011_GWF1_44_10]KKU01378.1 MAG: hypothetical protein UX04_C0009G0013 [Microgenomates group bacterium GW2011_GWF2_45_18]